MKNPLYWITSSMIAGAWAFFIAWDVFLAEHGGPTESMIMHDAGRASTFVPHIFGFLMGHWFMPRQHPWASGWMYGLVFWGVLLTWDLVWAIWVKTTPWYRFEGLWLLIGVASGAIFWSQPDGGSFIP